MSENDFRKEYMENYINWRDFKEKLIYENRFFLKHEVIERALKAANLNTDKIEKESVFYRARVYFLNEYLNIESILNQEKYIEDMKEDNEVDKVTKQVLQNRVKEKVEKFNTGFWGYSKGENLMPPKDVFTRGGRGNPLNIRYLYLSDSQYTALSEVRPYIDSKISIAKIINKSEKTIIDFSKYSNEDAFYNVLCSAFSTFCANEETDYLPTQFIAELIKNNGFDGIKYRSSLYSGGINYMFFSDNDFDDVESKIFQVNEIAIVAKCINKDDIPKIMHPDYFTFDDFKKWAEELNNENEDK